MPSELVIGSFAGTILVGTIVLYLPISSASGQTSFLDCLFTATSATCVTGLTVVRTGSHFTVFGRTVILLMIQLGGLGIMTASTFLLLLFGRSISLRERAVLRDTLNPARTRNLSRLVIYTVVFTVLVEALGVLSLYGAFKPLVGSGRAYEAAVFHSISAFCNAGFSTLDSNLEGLGVYPRIVATVMALYVIGGLGFFVVLDIVSGLRRKLTRRHLKGAPLFSLHTRLSLITVVILLVVGAAGLYLLEGHRLFAQMEWPYAVLASVFNSATARTAGFSTVPVSRMSDASLFLLTLLMFIGASPGSTGGGVKTTTFSLAVLFLLARMRGRSDVNVLGRRAPESAISKSLAIISMSIIVLSVAIFLLLILERGETAEGVNAPTFIQVVFEAFSAFGTVGLSTGITPHLTSGGKLVIIALMFVGRLGPLTVATLVATRVQTPRFSLPEENIMVG